MKLFLGNVKIVVDKCEHSSYLLINETGNNNQQGDKMENIDQTTIDFVKTMLTGDTNQDINWLFKNFKSVGFSKKEWAQIVDRAERS
jgi:hypothetical protein